MDVCILFKDGSFRKFTHQPRAGGSYNVSVKYEGGFVIVTDEWHNTTAFPMTDVSEVTTNANERAF